MRGKTPKLKPCPFCGLAAAIRRENPGGQGFVAGCAHVYAADPELCLVMPRSLPFATKAEAARAWNRRGDGAPKIPVWKGRATPDEASALRGIAEALWALQAAPTGALGHVADNGADESGRDQDEWRRRE